MSEEKTIRNMSIIELMFLFGKGATREIAFKFIRVIRQLLVFVIEMYGREFLFGSLQVRLIINHADFPHPDYQDFLPRGLAPLPMGEGRVGSFFRAPLIGQQSIPTYGFRCNRPESLFNKPDVQVSIDLDKKWRSPKM